MKKLMLALTVMGILGLTSCKQNWTCQCTNQNGALTNTAINGGTFYHAKHTCNAMNSSSTVAGVKQSENCSLLTQEH